MELVQTLLDNSVSTSALFVGTMFFIGAMILCMGLVEQKQKFRKEQAAWEADKLTKPDASRKPPRDETAFATRQLNSVMKAGFTARPLLNKAEANVFRALDAIVIEQNIGWQVMAQVSLGEILASSDDWAFRAINSKRVDFALMDAQCCVRHVIEYQGSGHHSGSTAAVRDAVKKEALRKAGIGYHEVIAGHTTPAELKALIVKLLPAAKTSRAA